jgi:hypothetical protein
MMTSLKDQMDKLIEQLNTFTAEDLQDADDLFYQRKATVNPNATIINNLYKQLGELTNQEGEVYGFNQMVDGKEPEKPAQIDELPY